MLHFLYMFIDCVKLNPKWFVQSTGRSKGKGRQWPLCWHILFLSNIRNHSNGISFMDSLHVKTYTVYDVRKDKPMKVILNYVLCAQYIDFSFNVTSPQLMLGLQFVILDFLLVYWLHINVHVHKLF